MVPPVVSILLFAAIGAKLIGSHGGLQVDKQKVCQVTGSVDSPSKVIRGGAVICNSCLLLTLNVISPDTSVEMRATQVFHVDSFELSPTEASLDQDLNLTVGLVSCFPRPVTVSHVKVRCQ